MIHLKFIYKDYDSLKKKWKREKVDILVKFAEIINSGILQRKNFYKEAQAALVARLVNEEGEETSMQFYDFKYIKHLKVELPEDTKKSFFKRLFKK